HGPSFYQAITLNPMFQLPGQPTQTTMADSITDATFVQRIIKGQAYRELLVSYASGKLEAQSIDLSSIPVTMRAINLGKFGRNATGVFASWDNGTGTRDYSEIIGISNGRPMALQSCDTTAELANIMNSNTFFGNVVSKSTTSASEVETVSVFYEKDYFTICLFNPSNAPRINGSSMKMDIVSCLISERYVAVICKDVVTVIAIDDIFLEQGEPCSVTGVRIFLIDNDKSANRDRQITAFHASSTLEDGKPTYVLGTSSGKLLRSHEDYFNQEKILVSREVEDAYMNESIVDIKENRETGWTMALGSEGTIVQLSPQHFTKNADEHTKLADTATFPQFPGAFVGFVTIQAEEKSERMDLVMTTSHGLLRLHELFTNNELFAVKDPGFSYV
ncbi:hypothetical protein PFISCL1PPCAC_20905, partial [Pristionchus fissidentatus]